MLIAGPSSPFRSCSKMFSHPHTPSKTTKDLSDILIIMASPQPPPPALQIYVDADPEAWFSRLRDRARCDDLDQAIESVRPREILLVNLLQRQCGKPDGHYHIPGRIHPPLSRVLATAMSIDKVAWWCPAGDDDSLASAKDVKEKGKVTLTKRQKEEAELAKRFRAEVDAMSAYDMVKRLEEERWIEEASRVPTMVPGPYWQAGLQEDVVEALALATDVKAEFRQRYQEVVEKAQMRPGKVAFKEELAKIEKETENVVVIEMLLKSLNRYLSRRRQHQPDHQVLGIDPIKAYLSAAVHLFWATANLFQLAPWDGVLMAEPSDVLRRRAGRILRRYITAVMCAEKGSQIVNAKEGEEDDPIRAGTEHLALD
ncbi:hypothetical protein B0T20DRAFT_56117 [Sordaria brevicollis]|uniref:Uncharacterized protein n=1 Tax=Sordaria brevicollis TaxID=83679 RepID=A0AAE0U6P9_SORBR|nr:hypothetical protein B0T20DRAFT_56117 [Sordaria brevicollis]